MRKRIMAVWICGVLSPAVFQIGCSIDFGKDSKGDKEADTGEAYGSFCHELTSDGGDVEISLLFEKDLDTAALTATTGTCSTGLDAACDQIPVGDAVSLKVKVDGRLTIAASMDIVGENEYEFYLDVEDDSLPVLYSRSSLTEESLSCSNSECDYFIRSPSTCDPSDPCHWVQDGTCDDACLSQVGKMFDDSSDCSTEKK